MSVERRETTTLLPLFEEWKAASIEEDAAGQALHHARLAVQWAWPEIPNDLFHEPADDNFASWRHHAVPCSSIGGGDARRWYGSAKSQAFIEGRRTLLEDHGAGLHRPELARIALIQAAYSEWMTSLTIVEEAAGLLAAERRFEAGRAQCASLRRRIALHPLGTFDDAVLKAKVITWTHCADSDEMADQLALSMSDRDGDGPTASSIALLLAQQIKDMVLPDRKAILRQEIATAERSLSSMVQPGRGVK